MLIQTLAQFNYKMRIYTLKKIVHQVAPPYFMDLIVFIYRAFRGKTQTVCYEHHSKADDIDVNSLYYVTSNPIFNLPANKVRHQGGQAYSSEQHHFIQYYRDGLKALTNYYDKHNPKTIFDKHFIYNHRGKQMTLPWILNNPHVVEGEHGLPFASGHSAYGPVDDMKLKLEVERLNLCLRSIKARGYLIKRQFPREDNGLPRGYFLVTNSGDWVFRVVGGKHRVAALVWLGWKNIPVCFEPSVPRCIHEADILSWPRVASGEFSKDDAKLIFDSYFRDPGVKLWQ
jgi:hypothetical protein